MFEKNEIQFNIGECVIYKTFGICIVDDIIKKDFGFGEKSYLQLKQLYGFQSIYYIPCDSENIHSLVRRTISKEEIDASILEAESLDIIWEPDLKKRNVFLNEIINNGSIAQKLLIFKILSQKKETAIKNKKRMYICDEKALATIEKLIVEEFSYVLNIDKLDVIPYIVQTIQ